MKNQHQKQLTAVAITAALALVQYGCGHKSADSSLKANVGFSPVTLPAFIQAESFNAATDLTQGNSGDSCDETNNGDVDLEPTTDKDGGCNIGWTQDGEVLDYYVLNRSSQAAEYDIDVRLAAGGGHSSLVLESPPGRVLGTVSAFGDGYVPGWQNWVTRTLHDVKIQPGLQIVRVKFQGGQNFNYLNIKASGGKIEGDTLLAETVIKRSCAKCHDYLMIEETINWAEVIKRAGPFKKRVLDQVSPMPPKSVGGPLAITPDEKTALLDYVSGLADHPVPQSKPINTRYFESKGMKLQRDLMAEGAGHIWGMVFLPDGNILATVKTGDVKIFNVAERRFINVKNPPRSANHGQGGLLDVGISSDFGDDKKVFLTYAKDLGNGQFTTALSSAILEGDTLKDLREIFVARGSNGKGEHFGGRIVIDSDNTIWLAVGERNDRTNSQRLDNHLGKVMRLTADGKAHPGNPFVTGGGLPEIYSYGHRNPQGLAKNHLTGEIWESEHGPKGGDEINSLRPGVNFGWPKATYGTEYDGNYMAPGTFEGTEQPMTFWVPSIAPSGLVVYSSDVLEGWKGFAISGALAGTHLNLTRIENHKKASEDRLFREDGLRIREVEQGPNGDLWYSTDVGHLFRIRKAE